MHDSFEDLENKIGYQAGVRAAGIVDEYLRKNKLVFPKYLTVESAALYTDFTPKALRDRIARGVGPVHFHVGKALRFKREDLDAWVEQGVTNGAVD